MGERERRERGCVCVGEREKSEKVGITYEQGSQLLLLRQIGERVCVCVTERERVCVCDRKRERKTKRKVTPVSKEVSFF